MTDIRRDLGPEWLASGQGPIQVITRGGLTCTSGIPGIDLTTGNCPDDPAGQFRLAFKNLIDVLADGGRAPETIALLEVTIAERELRSLIDAPWLGLFSDQAARPARKTNQRPLPAGQCVQVNAICLDGPRRSLEIPGLGHRAPIPMGAAVGPYVLSSVIGGEDPATGNMLAKPEEQIAQAFANCTNLMRSAGGDERGINHMWVFLSDGAQADVMLDAYLQLYPDPQSRPARKTLNTDLPEGCSIQLQIAGCLSERNANFEVEGFQHHDPIPLASRAGNWMQSSGIHGLAPGTREIASGGLAQQTRLALDTVDQLMINASGSQADIVGLTVFLGDFADTTAVHDMISGHWDGQPMPAVRFVEVELPPAMRVQFHVSAWIEP